MGGNINIIEDPSCQNRGEILVRVIVSAHTYQLKRSDAPTMSQIGPALTD